MDTMSKPENHNPDALLDALLHQLPDKPLASNFTARVLQAVDQEDRHATRAAAPWWDAFRHPLQLFPRLAVAALALGLGLGGFQRYETAAQTKMVRSVSAVAQVSSLPGPDVLRDFEAVRRLSQTPRADEELLVLLR
jgi:hypothetical protein